MDACDHDETRPVTPLGLPAALVAPDLDPAFWPPTRLGVASAWWGHVPFMHWLVASLRPGVAVELGTHNGVSFAAICEAMQRAGVPGRATAIDTWTGDRHSGAYGAEVFTELKEVVEARYGTFAELVPLTFDEAAPHFADGSIDLLHIDGLHTEEAVRHDFETWRPKLSERGVVILHDTNVRRDDFGVWKLWEDIARRHPSFAFLHAHGLGLAAMGRCVPEPVAALCALEPAAAVALRDRFAQLGARWIAADAASRAERLTDELRRHATGLETARDRAEETISTQGRQIADLDAEREQAAALAADRQRHIAGLEAERAQAEALASEQQRYVAELEAERAHAAGFASAQRQHIAALEAERERATTLATDQARHSANLEADRARVVAASAVQEQHIANLEAERARAARLLSVQRQRIADLDDECEGAADRASDRQQRIADLEAEAEHAAALAAIQFQHIAELERARAEDADRTRAEAPRPGPLGAWLRSRKTGGTARPEPVTPEGPELLPSSAPGPLAPSEPPESEARLIAESGLFDESAYAGRTEGRAQGLGPIAHYLAHGEAAGLAPSRHFDPSFYRESSPDLVETTGNLLVHYIRHGRAEGRFPRPAAADLVLPTARIRPDRDTIVVAVHDASRTGAPILGWNLVGALEARYNVVALLRRDGPLAPAFADLASASAVLPDGVDWDGAESRALADAIVRTYAPLYLIANSVETRPFVPAFERAGVPAVALVHEFASTVRPVGALHGLFRFASEIAFPARIVAEAALAEYRVLLARSARILPQGPCRLPPPVLPPTDATGASPSSATGVPRLPGRDGSVLVVGIGTITPRKGVEFFVAAAAATMRQRPACRITFAWVGEANAIDAAYRENVTEQVTRSGLGDRVLFLGELDDLEPVYARANILFLSSRLDPLPNVAIDAAIRGIPIVCFERASGIAELLVGEAGARELVVPHLDAGAAAERILALTDPDRHAAASVAMRALAARHFDRGRYVEAIDALGRGAARAMAQVARDRDTIRAHGAFNADLYRGTRDAPPDEALDAYLHASRRAAPRGRPRAGLLVRRPLEGFHPLIYAGENPDYVEAEHGDPLAHFARSGRPAGRWRHDVIRPPAAPLDASALRVAVHAHVYYPELFPDLAERLRRNRTPVDLFCTTSGDRAEALAEAVVRLAVPRARITAVPNRGRNIGPLLALGRSALGDYDVVAHVHAKRSPHVHAAVGDGWRDFLWENLLGGEHPMLDRILDAFAADTRLGLVFPEDPHLNDWDENRALAEALAARMGWTGRLQDHFDFPIGTMFFARPAALEGLFGLGLGWDDFPEEPLPIDGTILHALERLLPFSAARAGYGYATTLVEAGRR